MFLQFVFCEYNETGVSLSLNRSFANSYSVWAQASFSKFTFDKT